MRRIFVLLTFLAMMVHTQADPYRYQWRQFTGHSADLQPLFSWWVAAQNIRMVAVDLDQVSSNLFVETTSNAWNQLPAKPTPDWCLIRASRVSTAGARWFIQDAEIYLAPQIYKHTSLYLVNPPGTEYQNFSTCKDNLAALNTQLTQLAWQQASAQTNMGLAQAEADQYTKIKNAVPYSYTAANALAVATSNLTAATLTVNTLQGQKDALLKQMQPLSDYQSHFPDRTTYVLEHFARNTGQKINGVEVYDLGLAAGLNYPAQ